jgi:regulator of protease activity HflC (stomatin/prohibitin superfamily)
MFEPFFILIAVLVALVYTAIKILREYERGVIFLLGRFWKVKDQASSSSSPASRKWSGWICARS